MTFRILLPFGLILLMTAAAAQSSQTKTPDCSMQRLEPLLAEFVRAKAEYSSSSAVSAAELASASADLAAALDVCGLEPTCPDPPGSPVFRVPAER
jgi:hypothetical protein